jgi:MoaA/NifB/PqqE/SkfB family radical SAM enzyme
MDLEDVFKILDELSGYAGLDTVFFHVAGETLLYNDIWRCLDKCRELKIKSCVATNGVLLTDNNVKLLMEHPPDQLRISLQVLDPELHSRIRGTNMPFDVYAGRIASCLSTLLDEKHSIGEIRTDIAVNEDRFLGLMGMGRRMLKASGLITYGDPTIFSPNPKKLRSRLIDFLKLVEEKSSSFKISLQQVDENIDKYYSGENASTPCDIAYVLKKDNIIVYKNFFDGRPIAHNYPVQTALCKTDFLGILADGTVVCCCIDFDGLTGLGNIFRESLASILNRNKEVFDGLRFTGKLYFDVCKKCQGARTRTGASLKNAANRIRNAFASNTSR